MLTAIALDSEMTVRAVLRRLARNGLWLDTAQADAADHIREQRERVKNAVPLDEMARRMARNPAQFSCAIRRQLAANILWYARPAAEVLRACLRADPAAKLLDVLNLHEPDSRPTVPISNAASAPADAVVLDGSQPIGAGPERATEGSFAAAAPGRASGPRRSARRSATAAEPPAAPRDVRAWPRLDAPEHVPASTPFEVVVGFGRAPQAGVSGGEITLEAPAGVDTIALTVSVMCDGVDAPDGWSRQLDVQVSDPSSASVRFQLIGRPPSAAMQVTLTTIEARFVRDGAIVGSASRPLIIGQAGATAPPDDIGVGMSWLSQGSTMAPLAAASAGAADLTIELAKPDRNAANGSYVCKLTSPHTLSVGAGPYPIDLGDDAKTFARTVVDQVRQFSSDPIVDNLLESVGGLIADKLPAEALTAIREAAAAVAPNPPAILIVSADPYVPWELALISPPMDAQRPPYLGAQAIVGRWLQDGQRAAPGLTPRPATQPPSSIPVRHMAVMAGKYRAESGLRALPEAENEAQALVTTFNAVPLAASLQSLKLLLDAKLEQNFEVIGGADVVHFAGHGEFDPAKQDSSVLFLSDGAALSPLLFRSAKYGDDQQPLLFLNACMIGIGGELLGAMGGFPGNCLKGGFGGVVGALWEVDDTVAHEIALEFWKRALPATGKAGEPIGAILRDLRAKYADPGAPVESTYLAYVYYGHPRLTLQRAG